MKKFLFIAIGIVLINCSTPTHITGSWKNPNLVEKNYKTVLIAALTHNTVVRSTLEADLQTTLAGYKINGIKSIDEFPPGLQARDSIGKEELLADVRKKGYSAILTIAVLKKETDSRYVGSPWMYSPMMNYGYYGSFWGYYNYWYPYTYNPSYYSAGTTYYLETNLYDGQNEGLVWSGQTETYSYDGINSVSKEVAKAVIEKMRSDSIFGPQKPAKVHVGSD
jgi:hypothetical protein